MGRSDEEKGGVSPLGCQRSRALCLFSVRRGERRRDVGARCRAREKRERERESEGARAGEREFRTTDNRASSAMEKCFHPIFFIFFLPSLTHSLTHSLALPSDKTSSSASAHSSLSTTSS